MFLKQLNYSFFLLELKYKFFYTGFLFFFTFFFVIEILKKFYIYFLNFYY